MNTQITRKQKPSCWDLMNKAKGLASQQSPSFELNEMIDYLDATKFNCKDTPFLGNCSPFHCAMENAGWQAYLLKGCRELKVFWKEELGALKIQGSLPYFLKGHNFSFSRKEFENAVGLIEKMLGCCELWEADLETFENGVIMEVERSPKEYIRNHYAQTSSGFKKAIREKNAGNFCLWEGKVSDIKLYDAGANIIRKQTLDAREMLQQEGWNPDNNFLKFEVRYKKPAQRFNKGRAVELGRLQDEGFLQTLNEDLLTHYKQLKPMKEVMQPSNKKDFSTLDAVLITLANVMNQQGLPLQEAKKAVYSTINQGQCLAKADKDARKAQVRKAFGKLEEAESSQWDLEEALKDALQVI